MAKSAKSIELEFTPRLVNGIVKDVLEGFEAIESARGKYMAAARKHREQIGLVYERGAAQGIPQRVMKLQIKIEQTQAKLIGLVTDLENEERKLLQKVAKVRGIKAQLALFTELPKETKPRKPKSMPGVTGDDLTSMEEAAGNA